MQNLEIRNRIFLYEQTELNNDFLWEDLKEFLGVNHTLKHDRRVSAHGSTSKSITNVNFCDDEYDNFRAKMMPIAYNVSVWLQDYFIPIAKDESRSDVVIARLDTFTQLVEKYKLDPCGKLQRLDNGTYTP